MTDNEIIKALECCKDVSAKTCRDCPFYNFHSANCVTVLAEKSLDLIERRQTEIDELRKIIADGCENSELIYPVLTTLRSYVLDDFRKQRTEAVKEFAQRVKNAFYYHFDELIPSIMADEIDKIMEEMVGDVDAFIEGTELALDYGLQIPEEDLKKYKELVGGNNDFMDGSNNR